MAGEPFRAVVDAWAVPRPKGSKYYKKEWTRKIFSCYITLDPNQDDDKILQVRLEDRKTRALLAVCPYDGQHGINSVSDSARNYVLVIANKNLEAWLGIEFRDSSDSIDFSLAIQSFMRRQISADRHGWPTWTQRKTAQLSHQNRPPAPKSVESTPSSSEVSSAASSQASSQANSGANSPAHSPGSTPLSSSPVTSTMPFFTNPAIEKSHKLPQDKRPEDSDSDSASAPRSPPRTTVFSSPFEPTAPSPQLAVGSPTRPPLEHGASIASSPRIDSGAHRINRNFPITTPPILSQPPAFSLSTDDHDEHDEHGEEYNEPLTPSSEEIMLSPSASPASTLMKSPNFTEQAWSDDDFGEFHS